eukprot:427073-Rhodomonas_salina.1
MQYKFKLFYNALQGCRLGEGPETPLLHFSFVNDDGFVSNFWYWRPSGPPEDSSPSTKQPHKNSAVQICNAIPPTTPSDTLHLRRQLR